MSVFTQVDEEQREELGIILTDVLSSVLREEALATDRPLPAGPAVSSRLAVQDQGDEIIGAAPALAVVEIRTGIALARVMAARMMSLSTPEVPDLVDALAEVNNIAGGNVKTLLCHHARLSLPSAQISNDGEFAGAGSAEASTWVRAIVLGHVAQLAIYPDAPVADLLWPPVNADLTLEPTT